MNRSTSWLAEGTPYQTKYHLLSAKEQGPVCMITAGVHGNEIAAPLAAKDFPLLQLKKGTLIIVPVVNQQAFRAGLRGKPDLNRTFPHTSKSNAQHPLAIHLIGLAKRFRPTMCLDLHEGWGFHQLTKAAFGQTLITNPSSSLKPLVHRVIHKMNISISNGVHHFKTRFSVLPGSLRTAMTQLLRIPTVTVETSTALALPVRIRYQKEIVHHFLGEVGLI